eukprot:4426861-Pyramimonas_sp.AAC.1
MGPHHSCDPKLVSMLPNTLHVVFVVVVFFHNWLSGQPARLLEYACNLIAYGRDAPHTAQSELYTPTSPPVSVSETSEPRIGKIRADPRRCGT